MRLVGDLVGIIETTAFYITRAGVVGTIHGLDAGIFRTITAGIILGGIFLYRGIQRLVRT